METEAGSGPGHQRFVSNKAASNFIPNAVSDPRRVSFFIFESRAAMAEPSAMRNYKRLERFMNLRRS